MRAVVGPTGAHNPGKMGATPMPATMAGQRCYGLPNTKTKGILAVSPRLHGMWASGKPPGLGPGDPKVRILPFRLTPCACDQNTAPRGVACPVIGMGLADSGSKLRQSEMVPFDQARLKYRQGGGFQFSPLMVG